MHIATCKLKLSLDGVRSLKEKRQILKSILARLSNQFNVAVAEVEHQDVWQTAVIGLAAIGSDAGHCQRLVDKAVEWIERNRPDLYIVEIDMEMR